MLEDKKNIDINLLVKKIEKLIEDEYKDPLIKLKSITIRVHTGEPNIIDYSFEQRA